MQGEYIKDRLLPGFVADACQQFGFTMSRFSDDWVLRIDGNSKRRWVLGYTFDINSAGAVGVASDKVATAITLAAEGVSVVEHYLVRTHVNQELLYQNLRELDPERPVVIKPLSGSGGRGVRLMPNPSDALEYIRASAHPDWAISPYSEIRSEKRAVMLDGEVLCSYEKTNPYDKDGLKMFNLSYGAKAVNCELSHDERVLAERALRASGLRAASVDIATSVEGNHLIMEINSGMTMEHYARQSDEGFAIAARVYRELVRAMLI